MTRLASTIELWLIQISVHRSKKLFFRRVDLSTGFEEHGSPANFLGRLKAAVSENHNFVDRGREGEIEKVRKRERERMKT